jgi:glycosyltransferase involved in cell wall biosynthesis
MKSGRASVNGKVAILSLRFNPAFLQHIIAYARAVTELGMAASLIMDPVYRGFPELEKAAPILNWAEARAAGGWTHAIFLNVAAENRKAARELKARGAKIYYLYHEPWQMSLEYLRTEGLGATVRAALAHRMTVPVLRMAEKVILQSEYGLAEYRRVDARHNERAVCFPLIYEDDAGCGARQAVPAKPYFSFIGKPCRSHGFDQYLAVVRHALANGRGLQFLIASRHAAPDSLAWDPLVRRNADRVEIRCGRPLTNAEINLCYAQSFCVWNLYRRSTQSGVLPKAYMFGAPVIASRIGSFPEFMQPGITGLFADGGDVEGILAALEEIQRNRDGFAANCRKMFLETFYYRARLEDLRRVLQ